MKLKMMMLLPALLNKNEITWFSLYLKVKIQKKSIPNEQEI